ncbi:unnamed protein product [Bursaphelenchus xylophilus]|uniref:(pine wood nematode) hypothetical protein n=1 Tax=Bursaphelenchus xylophilus TaxID=6326 RepID=A0A1I7S0P0_BURXY|nr:unnamed protein product [Bursaphelenchus xylophilus]CAG9088473.1 unnamed protein product [Bursaphelenchus xylophilus]
MGITSSELEARYQNAVGKTKNALGRRLQELLSHHVQLVDLENRRDIPTSFAGEPLFLHYRSIKITSTKRGCDQKEEHFRNLRRNSGGHKRPGAQFTMILQLTGFEEQK